MASTVKVYEVLHDTGRGGGPAADGTVVARFRREVDAKRFAAGRTCYGRPATVQADEVPRRLAQRWGL